MEKSNQQNEVAQQEDKTKPHIPSIEEEIRKQENPEEGVLKEEKESEKNSK